MARHHQRWVTRYAWLMAIAGVLAFVVSPWLFAPAAVFVLLASDHLKDRNRRSDRLKADEGRSPLDRT